VLNKKEGANLKMGYTIGEVKHNFANLFKERCDL